MTRRQLPLATKIVYGSGDWSLSSFNTLRQIFYIAFLTDVVGLDALLASFAVLAGVAWDAINDPFVGALSDRMRTRWGRRRPFLLLFAVPFGLAFVGLWWAPPWSSQWALALHVALAYMLTDTLQSLVTVPFFALTPELTSDYDERTALTAWRMFFNLSASLAVAVAAPSIVDSLLASGSTAQQAYLVVGALFGALGVVPPLLIAATVREKPTSALSEREPGVLETLKGAWRNEPFRALTVLYLLNWITFDLLGLMIPYYVRWYLAGGDSTASYTLLGLTLPVESWMLGALLLVSLPMLPLWSAVCERLEKRSAYALAMGLWLIVQIAVFAVPPGAFGLAVLVAVGAGAGVAAAHVIPDAMLPDVLDLDELESGHRNEGIYYGARNLFRKAAGAMASFLALQTLGWAGYASQAAHQSDGALLAIRVLTGPVGALLLLGAMASAWFYPMTRARHAQIRAELAARADLRGGP
jgi:GPH family glycoside/pentoside/hexuronide:cation symporter